MAPRILFLAHGLGEVSCRFRIFQYVPGLRRLGFDPQVADLNVPLPARWRLLRAAAGFDAVCVHRAFLGPLDHWWLRRVGIRYVFDFDDAIMLNDSSHRRLESRSRLRRFLRMVTGARAVIAGNNYLADWAAPHTTRVTVIPTPIDLTPYPAQRAEDTGDPIVGWIGTRSNLGYLQLVLPALARLSRTRPRLRVKIVADDFIDAPGVQVIKKPWAQADEVADLASFHVGIMPLPDDAWTRGKCAVKILQYFAASVPVVCSPVGVNRDIVRDGDNGTFARTDDEWVARLEELLADSDKRRRWGESGRATVTERYSVDVTLPRLVQVLQSP